MKDPMLMRCWDNVVAFIDAGGCFELYRIDEFEVCSASIRVILIHNARSWVS